MRENLRLKILSLVVKRNKHRKEVWGDNADKRKSPKEGE
jgi:hypothetical protein